MIDLYTAATSNGLRAAIGLAARDPFDCPVTATYRRV